MQVWLRLFCGIATLYSCHNCYITFLRLLSKTFDSLTVFQFVYLPFADNNMHFYFSFTPTPHFPICPPPSAFLPLLASQSARWSVNKICDQTVRFVLRLCFAFALSAHRGVILRYVCVSAFYISVCVCVDWHKVRLFNMLVHSLHLIKSLAKNISRAISATSKCQATGAFQIPR